LCPRKKIRRVIADDDGTAGEARIEAALMPHKHLDSRLLERLLQGAISPAEARELVRHLAESCPDCGRIAGLHGLAAGALKTEALSPILAGAGTEGIPGEPEKGISFERVRQRLEGAASLVVRQREEAPALLAELDRHPLERQRMLVRNNARFQTLPLADLLLERAWSAGLEEPAAGEAIADLACELMDQIEPALFGGEVLNDLRARAWAYRGNFRRIATDFRGAEEALQSAEVFLERGTGDILEQARLQGLRGSLCVAQYRIEEAQELYLKAFHTYIATEEGHLAGRTLLQLGHVAKGAGQLEQAMRLFEEGLERVDPEQEPRLLFVGHQNLLGCLIELGRFEEASAQLPLVRRLTVDRATRADLLNLRWREGHILQGLGHDSRAEAAFLEVRKGFIELEIAYEAAFVSLDLAALYLRQGRTAEIRQLVGEVVPIFQSRDVHRDALAAVLLLQRAVAMETLTLKTVEEVAEVIRRSPGKPASRREEPS
jgi:tetratricopeptide (TPR) repeat protein